MVVQCKEEISFLSEWIFFPVHCLCARLKSGRLSRHNWCWWELNLSFTMLYCIAKSMHRIVCGIWREMLCLLSDTCENMHKFPSINGTNKRSWLGESKAENRMSIYCCSAEKWTCRFILCMVKITSYDCKNSSCAHHAFAYVTLWQTVLHSCVSFRSQATEGNWKSGCMDVYKLRWIGLFVMQNRDLTMM